MSPRVAIIGECMIELRHLDPTHLALGYAGDTLNTAVYLARRLGRPGAVQYVTAVGTDAYSEAMVAGWEAEGIGTAAVLRVPGAQPGLYLIRTDADGERSFTYYRSASPARRLFDDLQPAVDLSACTLVYLSGITLSLLTEPARRTLWTLLDRARAAGARVAFDSNYRPAGWPDAAAAARTMTEMLRRTDIALPGLDDERDLFGDATPADCVARLQELGVAEVVVKTGPDGALVADRTDQRAVPTTARAPVDTTAAGDSFNGGYLAARLTGADPWTAARAGHRLAGVVVGHGGAIVPVEEMPAVETTPEA